MQKEQQFQKIKQEAIEKQHKDEGLNIYESDQFKNKMVEISKKLSQPKQTTHPIQINEKLQPKLEDNQKGNVKEEEGLDSYNQYINMYSKKGISKKVEEENIKLNIMKKQKEIFDRESDTKWQLEARDNAMKEKEYEKKSKQQMQQILKMQMEKDIELANVKKQTQKQTKNSEKQLIQGLNQVEQEIIKREKIEALSKKIDNIKSYEYDLDRIQSKYSPKHKEN